MKGESMKRPDVPRRLSRIETLLTAVVGIGGGLLLALYSFIQLRTAWLEGSVALGGRNAIDIDYDSEPLSYIVAMSALYPAAIVCGIGLAAVSAIILMRQRELSRQKSLRKSR
jgi:TRAP-type C4-dicarboxylate transport system permease small subunit